MITKNIDRKAEALQALRLAHLLDDKRHIVINVLECILKTYSNLDNSCVATDGCNTDMISREQFIQDLNDIINELKNNNIK